MCLLFANQGHVVSRNCMTMWHYLCCANTHWASSCKGKEGRMLRRHNTIAHNPDRPCERWKVRWCHVSHNDRINYLYAICKKERARPQIIIWKPYLTTGVIILRGKPNSDFPRIRKGLLSRQGYIHGRSHTTYVQIFRVYINVVTRAGINILFGAYLYIRSSYYLISTYLNFLKQKDPFIS